MGLGGYPATDEKFLGMLGMHGTYEANMAMHNCDLILAVGARLDCALLRLCCSMSEQGKDDGKCA